LDVLKLYKHIETYPNKEILNYSVIKFLPFR
jgi:hypothetical protein